MAASEQAHPLAKNKVSQALEIFREQRTVSYRRGAAVLLSLPRTSIIAFEAPGRVNSIASTPIELNWAEPPSVWKTNSGGSCLSQTTSPLQHWSTPIVSVATRTFPSAHLKSKFKEEYHAESLLQNPRPKALLRDPHAG